MGADPCSVGELGTAVALTPSLGTTRCRPCRCLAACDADVWLCAVGSKDAVVPGPCSLPQKGRSRMSRQSRTELLKTAVVDRAIRAPSNERNRETGPTSDIQVRHADLADHGRLHAAPRRHRITLPPGPDRRLPVPCCSKQICNRPSSIRFHRTGHGKVVLGPLLSCVIQSGARYPGRSHHNSRT